MPYLLAHMSDIHFFAPSWSPTQIFSKEIIGNCNYFFRRRHEHDANLAYEPIRFWEDLETKNILITGDYTCTSSRREFLLMRSYVKNLLSKGFRVFTLPGNHDVYTPKAQKERLFFRYLEDMIDFQGDTDFHLERDRACAYHLSNNWWLVLVDCSFATSIIRSTGSFTIDIEHALCRVLEDLPETASIIVAGHFPAYPFKHPYGHLERNEVLDEIIAKDPRIHFYVHGHRHLVQVDKKPHYTMLDSGSISLKEKSCFHQFSIHQDSVEIATYQQNQGKWSVIDGQQSSENLV